MESISQHHLTAILKLPREISPFKVFFNFLPQRDTFCESHSQLPTIHLYIFQQL